MNPERNRRRGTRTGFALAPQSPPTVPLDQTDAKILELLIEDANRSYREIADHVGLTAPTVSERVERMREVGVLQRFTVAVDQSMLSGQDARLVEVQVPPGEAGDLTASLGDVDAVEHVFQTESGRILVHVHAPEPEVRRLFDDLLADRDVLSYEVSGVVESDWNPDLRRGEFSITCVECGKDVDDDGVSVELDGRQYFVCCESCESLFEERYAELEEGLGD